MPLGRSFGVVTFALGSDDLKGPQGSKLIRSTIGTDKSIPWQCDRSGDSVANAERCGEVNDVTVENELRLRIMKERRNSRGKWWLLGDKREPPKTARIPSAS